MSESPHTKILDRDQVSSVMTTEFSDTSELLKEVTNYGTNLVVRSFVSAEKRDIKEMVILGILLKNAVAMLDAVEILISSGALFAAHLPARSLFETYLYMRWILDTDAERRACQYFVWHSRIQRTWARRDIPGTEEYESFASIRHRFHINRTSEEKRARLNKAKDLLDEVNGVLSRPEYASIDNEFDSLKGRRKHDVGWYQASGGPSSRRQMAKLLGMLEEYDVFYTALSRIAHGEALPAHVTLAKQELILSPIRHLKGINTFLSWVLSLAFRTYRLVLDEYRPEELENYTRKYYEQWRARYHSIKDVEYTEDRTDPI